MEYRGLTNGSLSENCSYATYHTNPDMFPSPSRQHPTLLLCVLFITEQTHLVFVSGFQDALSQNVTRASVCC